MPQPCDHMSGWGGWVHTHTEAKMNGQTLRQTHTRGFPSYSEDMSRDSFYCFTEVFYLFIYLFFCGIIGSSRLLSKMRRPDKRGRSDSGWPKSVVICATWSVFLSLIALWLFASHVLSNSGQLICLSFVYMHFLHLSLLNLSASIWNTPGHLSILSAIQMLADQKNN